MLTAMTQKVLQITGSLQTAVHQACYVKVIHNEQDKIPDESDYFEIDGGFDNEVTEAEFGEMLGTLTANIRDKQYLVVSN